MIEDAGGTPARSEGVPADEANDDTTPLPKVVVLPDSSDTRLLVDLTSYANDLGEAAHSLGIALDCGEGSELWEPLTSHAVTAYIRPFILSNFRDRLDEMPEFPGIPSELMATHEMIRKYRNAKVAHSQSDLVMPLPVAFLGDTGEVRRVFGTTITHQMPLVIAERFAHLVSAMRTTVDEMTQPVTERLLSWAQSRPPESVRDWEGPEISASIDTDFSAARERKRTPRLTAYWQISQADDAPPLSGALSLDLCTRPGRRNGNGPYRNANRVCSATMRIGVPQRNTSDVWQNPFVLMKTVVRLPHMACDALTALSWQNCRFS